MSVGVGVLEWDVSRDTVAVATRAAYVLLALIPINQARCKLKHRRIETVSIRLSRHQLLVLSTSNWSSVDSWRRPGRLRSLGRALVCESEILLAHNAAVNVLCVFGELGLLCCCLRRRINPGGMMRHIDVSTMS